MRMEQNLTQIADGEMMAFETTKALAWRAWFNMVRTALDTGAMMHCSKEQALTAIALEGEKCLKRALDRGKGVIALSAHLGAFSLIGMRLRAEGYRFSAVVKLPRHPRFARLIEEYCAQLGMETISARPRSRAVKGVIKALRANHVVLVIADEFRAGGLEVNFLGWRVGASRGPATLALRTGAAILAMYALRRSDGSICLSIGPEITPVQSEDVGTSIAATTVLSTRCLEEVIRSHPEQWNWLAFPPQRPVGRQRQKTPPDETTSNRE